MNSCGVGGASEPLDCCTRALPPPPPPLELVKASFNWMKVAWGDRTLESSSLDEATTYSLQMQRISPLHGEIELVLLIFFYNITLISFDYQIIDNIIAIIFLYYQIIDNDITIISFDYKI